MSSGGSTKNEIDLIKKHTINISLSTAYDNVFIHSKQTGSDYTTVGTWVV